MLGMEDDAIEYVWIVKGQYVPPKGDDLKGVFDNERSAEHCRERVEISNNYDYVSVKRERVYS
jgi:hypothetical protein